MKQRLGPKAADRRRRRAKNLKMRRRTGWQRNRLAVSRIVRRRRRRKQPTELEILLRLINIVGLVLLVLVVAVLSGNKNVKEVVELGWKLFRLVP